MGFSRNGIRFLAHCRSRGVDFTSCATIGRQLLYANVREVQKSLAKVGVALDARQANALFETAGSYAEPLLKLLGASSVESFDASEYEGATHIADFNAPLPSQFKARYSVVIDGGSLEHVFNYPQGLKNAMELVRPGGHLILMTPTHSRSGHGFYQLSPELFHRVLGTQNGYAEPEVLVHATKRDTWYRVADPHSIGGRVIISPRLFEDELFVVARRESTAEVFASWPQQSDYAAAWQAEPTLNENGGWKSRLRRDRHRIPRTLLRLHAFVQSMRTERSMRGLHRADLH